MQSPLSAVKYGPGFAGSRTIRTTSATNTMKARVDGAPNGRFFDGLMQKPDGTWAGIEVKSGGATRTGEQRSFDGLVSYDNPAYATIDGKLVKITSVILKKFP